jgi:hypothetical protein
MSRKEAPRVGLLKALVAGRIRSTEVAEAMHVSDRHVRRFRVGNTNDLRQRSLRPWVPSP